MLCCLYELMKCLTYLARINVHTTHIENNFFFRNIALKYDLCELINGFHISTDIL